MLVGFCAVEVAGDPPVNDHDHEVGVLVERSVKLMEVPAFGDVLLADLDKENQKLIFTLKNSPKSKSEKSEA